MANKKVSLLLDTSRGVFIYSLVAPNNIVSPPAMVTGDVYDIELSLVKKKNNSEANTEPLPAGTYTGARFAIVAKNFTPVSGKYKVVFGSTETIDLDYNVGLTAFTSALNTAVKAHYSSVNDCVTVQQSPNLDAFIIKFIGDATAPDGLLDIQGDSLLPKCIPLIAKIADANAEHNGVFAIQLKRVPAAYVELTEATYFLDNSTEYARKPFIGVLSLNTEEMASHIFGSDTYDFLVEIELMSSGSGRETAVQQTMTIGRDYIVDGAYYTSPIDVQTLGAGVYDALNAATGPSTSNPFITVDEIIPLLSNSATSTLDPTAPTSGQALTYDGTDLIWATVSGGGGGSSLPLAGGTMTGAIVFDATGLQNINKGTFDNSTGGYNGISLTCAVGYELNWQGGHLANWYSGGLQNLYVDSPIHITNAGGITFSDASVQTTAALPLTGGTLTANSTLLLSDATYDSEVSGWGFGVQMTGDITQNAFIAYDEVSVSGSSYNTSIAPTGVTITGGGSTLSISTTGITFADSTVITTAPVAGVTYRQTIALAVTAGGGNSPYWMGANYVTGFYYPSGGTIFNDWTVAGKFKVQINGYLFGWSYLSNGTQYLNTIDDTSTFTPTGTGETLYLHYDGETSPYPFLIT